MGSCAATPVVQPVHRVHAFGRLPVTDSPGLDPTKACSEKHGYPLTGPVDISENIDLISASEISPAATCDPVC